ncbi:cysteine--tRNA ligase [Celeribacter litoreus]|uniref:cysteine--tRNA ligase n=1 Tax=Celeribacter litoreus TaxID=2876714 RepID=UPI001CCD864B|nr:cysteine--tRNA ligase [Celeribacter litoreus]MCA0043730.1 cysteine--tRNA ligase [Celeribacter litoreus]
MTDIWLTNTKTRQKEKFAPIDPDNVRMYVCGPTVYDRAHIGNARPVIVFDVLYRLLRHVYGPDHVTYVRNFTDVDDKINARAAESGRSIKEITNETTQWYLDDMREVGAMDPDQMPRATDYIGAMITMIEGLIANGHAYAAEGHVLFAVESYKDYGALSGRSIDDMIAGARVEVAPYKRNPMDFVLWKPSTDDLPGWDSPWGRGRPGWHIECSAMSYELLGETFDIHGGGNDLMFPHHENEIAQSCCAHEGAGFAKVWLHNEMLQVEGKKMSKSLGNFFTVRDLLDGHDGLPGVPGEVIRFVFLSTHYRKPMDWTAEKAEQAKATLKKWRKTTDGVEAGEPAPEVISALADDLNTAGAIAELHKLYEALRNVSANDDLSLNILNVPDRILQRFADVPPSKFLVALKAEVLASANLLGLLTPELGGWEATGVDLTAYADQLFALRQSAMETKDFSSVDAMKTALLDAGVEVRMSKTGVELEPGPKFDAAKLEGLL